MTCAIRHVRTNRATSNRGSHGSASHGTGTTSASDATQRTRGAPPQEEPPKKRGRKPSLVPRWLLNQVVMSEYITN